MGVIKRLIKNLFQNRLLAKLGASQRGSHQLVAMPTCQPVHPRHPASLEARTRPLNRKGRHRGQHRRRALDCLNGNSFEAELVASLSRMPALRFHPVHGPNALISPDGTSARRTQSFCQAIVFSDRLIMPNERVYVRVLDIAKGWNGTIRFGFTACDPDSFRYENMPKHACPDMTNAGHTWAHALADELVRRDTIIHFSYNTSGFIQYGINGHDCGMFVAKAKISEPLWFIIDIYGLTTAIELVDSRAGNWLRPRAQQPAPHNNQYQQLQHQRHELHPTENQLLLPNLSSLILRTSEQNIYTTMPIPNQTTTTTTNINNTTTPRQANVNRISNQNNDNNVTSSHTRRSRDSRKQQQHDYHSIQTNSKRNQPLQQHHQNQPKTNGCNTATSKIPNGTIKNNNNNTPQAVKVKSKDKEESQITKDCPICFERPINCVLYQCGHMCTCYECGVKQWRTQSRTCPICRTVIKDVIKTYLS